VYDRILVPTDGSDTAAVGLTEAIKLARSQRGRIRLIHVVNELVVVSGELSGTTFGDVVELLRSNGEALLHEAETTVRAADVEVEVRLVEVMGGQAGTSIVKEAQSWPADLIVCGTHGRRGIRRIVMGSDAEYIVRHSPVPVLLVRNKESRGK
jgi:nucleotide-binding universal stress UspA family protein